MNIDPQAAMLVLILLMLLGFTAMMIKDVAAHRNLGTSSKVLWIIGIVILPAVGPLVYFFARKNYSH